MMPVFTIMVMYNWPNCNESTSSRIVSCPRRRFAYEAIVVDRSTLVTSMQSFKCFRHKTLTRTKQQNGIDHVCPQIGNALVQSIAFKKLPRGLGQPQYAQCPGRRG